LKISKNKLLLRFAEMVDDSEKWNIELKRLLFLKLCTIVVFFAQNSKIYAREDDDKINLSLDVASGFVWRGLVINTLPVLQPSFSFSPGKFSMGAWASTPLVSGSDQPQELDLFANYRLLPFLSINITDYYIYNANSSNSYFNYHKNETCHALDLQLIYSGCDRFPIKAMISTIIAGNDPNSRGNNNYSTYIELGYENSLKGVDWEVFAGMVPMSSSFYAIDGAHVINLGLGLAKKIPVTESYSLPLSMTFTINPAAKSVFLSAIMTLF
jgi:hypothetical protein